MTRIFIGYVPVIHRGYLKLWEELGDCPIYFLDGSLLDLLPHLARDVRACTGVMVCQMARTCVRQAGVISSAEWLLKIVGQASEVIMPDEDISRAVYDQYLSELPVAVQFRSVWLRWDRQNTVSELSPPSSRLISIEEFDRELLGIARREADQSSDWWRQIGALLVDNGRVVISAFNRHQPTDHTPYIDGDPRFNFNWGERIDLSTALHAEAGVIGQAAARGFSTRGTSLYVSTFPCPPCAYLIRAAQLSQVYYAGGYSLLQAGEILTAAGIELIKIE